MVAETSGRHGGGRDESGMAKTGNGDPRERASPLFGGIRDMRSYYVLPLNRFRGIGTSEIPRSTSQSF